MVGLSREAIEGAAVDGLGRRRSAAPTSASPPFPPAGQAHDPAAGKARRCTWSPGSREIPTSPPRKLVVVRDVTAGQGRRPDDPLAVPVPPGPRRGPHAPSCAARTPRSRPSATAIARDLHDGPVQGVIAASLSLEAALLMIKAGETDRGIEVLAKIREELAGEADALRRLMSGLRPPVLEERGLIPACARRSRGSATDHEVTTEFNGRGARGRAPDDLETLAYRVVQEALSNAGKHARRPSSPCTSRPTTPSSGSRSRTTAAGSSRHETREFLRQGRVGLASMRERVELASGTFVVRSSPGRGTAIMATLPVDDSPAKREPVLHEAS